MIPHELHRIYETGASPIDVINVILGKYYTPSYFHQNPHTRAKVFNDQVLAQTLNKITY